MAVTVDNSSALAMLPSNVPASRAFAITPSNSNYLSLDGTYVHPTRFILCSADSTVKCTFLGGVVGTDDVTLTLKAGVLYPFAVKFVYSSGTNLNSGTIHGFR